MVNPLSIIVIAPIRAYQKYISPGLPRRCRYYPSCSEYSVTALQRHGIIKGVILGSWRILRCNPWSRGGVDHVPEKGRWKAPEWIPPDDWVGYDIEEKPTWLQARRANRAQRDSVRPTKAGEGLTVGEDLSDRAPTCGANSNGEEPPQQKES